MTLTLTLTPTLTVILPLSPTTIHSPLTTFRSPLSTPNFSHLTPHSPLPSPHTPLPALYSSLHTPHSTLLTPHSSLPTLHSSFHTTHSRLLTLHSLLSTPHTPLLTPHSPLSQAMNPIGENRERDYTEIALNPSPEEMWRQTKSPRLGGILNPETQIVRSNHFKGPLVSVLLSYFAVLFVCVRVVWYIFIMPFSIMIILLSPTHISLFLFPSSPPFPFLIVIHQQAITNHHFKP